MSLGVIHSFSKCFLNASVWDLQGNRGTDNPALLERVFLPMQALASAHTWLLFLPVGLLLAIFVLRQIHFLAYKLLLPSATLKSRPKFFNVAFGVL